MTARSKFRLAKLAVSAMILALSPSLAFASTETDLIAQIAGLFYVVVGLALVAAFLQMGAGLMMWVVRLGTDNSPRDVAIHRMEYAVATLFTLVLVLGVVEFIQTHLSQTLYILSVGLIGLFAWLVITSGAFSGGGEEKKEDH
ncbi:MAG: hypothetical protein P4L81_05215 [Candidatus Pacebacteria bacterium]|nr:hypothetical protein [Candidatus Paceibacterota bacterium]